MVQCPINTHCEWGFCECNTGFTKNWGQCSYSSPRLSPSRASLDPSSLSCAGDAACQAVDINLVCLGNTCTCRRDMQWNTKAAECQVDQWVLQGTNHSCISQILLDVDCSATTYNSPVAPLVQATVEQCTDLMDTGAGGYNFVTDCEVG